VILALRTGSPAASAVAMLAAGYLLGIIAFLLFRTRQAKYSQRPLERRSASDVRSPVADGTKRLA
jgi:hypothetical protein